MFSGTLYGWRSLVPRSRHWLIALVTVALLVIATPLLAQIEPTPGNKIDGYPVMLDNVVVFRVKQGLPGLASAAERVNLINQRLQSAVDDPKISPGDIRVVNEKGESIVKAGDMVLFTIRESDATAYGQTQEALAKQAVDRLQTVFKQYREERSIQKILFGALGTVLSTVLLVSLFKLQERLFTKLRARMRAARQANRLEVRIQNYQLLGSDSVGYLLSGLIQLLKLLVIAGMFYLYIPFVLKQFPVTNALGDRIFQEVGKSANYLIQSFVQYLPNLITIVLIGVVTYYAIGFAKLVISELGRGDAYTWFFPEWVDPTNRLITFLILALAFVVASPYLPGFGSPAFQGISIFLGALLSLGASTTVANAISGVILIYTRAFQVGDFIQIGDVRGEVVESSLFVTRLLTFKQEVITLPNSSVISNHVMNYTAILRRNGGHLLLHTTITLGYDAPWRKVHEVLIEAARATKGIIAEPVPFILQTSLNDYHISYEINAFTDHPHLMPQTYSYLHQNIQDYCNQAGIEILSPGFSALRDGNHTTIPADYLPDDYVTPGFQIQEHNGRSSST